ncbi:histidinol-phosphatase HisJ [Halobacillus litoralis]|uniref:histidinol-phosphatase HisJ n=1 Tax=Halobacillus litoralis TaxID=45668 RepID=UPI001CD67329|nr:histidinol-phosphatase HisJ [Halobacillus litoralis]MCA0969801.1 histidinol-phosphatase HisJ [Halobacillus litoralis]
MRDGHIHTPYCPHGTLDSLKEYVEKAIHVGYSTMTFTEHAPLPPSFVDPVPDKDSGMNAQDVEQYLKDLNGLKAEYEKDITIFAGFELDYISGYEKETEAFLTQYGPELDDGILSVHFLQGNSGWYCLDFSPDMFREAVLDFGGIEQMYEAYFRQVRASIETDLGPFKPSRIGHMTLIRKFHELFPSPSNWQQMAVEVLRSASDHHVELDYNGAGTQKPHCNETYPTKPIAEQAHAMGIPLVYGSDAHSASGLKQGYQQLSNVCR